VLLCTRVHLLHCGQLHLLLTLRPFQNVVTLITFISNHDLILKLKKHLIHSTNSVAVVGLLLIINGYILLHLEFQIMMEQAKHSLPCAKLRRKRVPRGFHNRITNNNSAIDFRRLLCHLLKLEVTISTLYVFESSHLYLGKRGAIRLLPHASSCSGYYLSTGYAFIS